MISEYDGITWPDYGLQECCHCTNKRAPDEFVACVECGVVLCDECSKHLGFGDYCKYCAVCKRCGNEALTFCEVCSDLLCPDHSQDYVEEELGYKNVETRCGGGCR